MSSSERKTVARTLNEWNRMLISVERWLDGGDGRGRGRRYISKRRTSQSCGVVQIAQSYQSCITYGVNNSTYLGKASLASVWQ